jgi:hypothetical protein
VSKLRIKNRLKTPYNGLGIPTKTIANKGGLGDVISAYHTGTDSETITEIFVTEI